MTIKFKSIFAHSLIEFLGYYWMACFRWNTATWSGINTQRQQQQQLNANGNFFRSLLPDSFQCGSIAQPSWILCMHALFSSLFFRTFSLSLSMSFSLCVFISVCLIVYLLLECSNWMGILLFIAPFWWIASTGQCLILFRSVWFCCCRL